MACPSTPFVLNGHVNWSMTRDSEGNRTYKISHRVKVDASLPLVKGPATALSTSGLPVPGAVWSIDGDTDVDAICQYDATVTPDVQGQRSEFWTVEQIFTTKANPFCITDIEDIDDPLAQPPIIRGGFSKFTQEQEFDINGNPIVNSAFEKIRGPQVEFDRSKANISITTNYTELDLPAIALFMDNVNSVSLWGFDERCVKLSNVSWERKYTGNCDCYFAVTYEFDIDINTFDRQILDEGTKALHGKWNKTTGLWEITNIGAFGVGITPNPANPNHFIRLTDINGNPMRGILNGAGIPASVQVGTGTTTNAQDPGRIDVLYYPGIDFVAVLGIPSDIECE